MAHEQSQFPPSGVEYTFVHPMNPSFRLVRSPIKGFMRHFRNPVNCDVIEAVISPVLTDQPWIHSMACFQEAVAFNLLGVPVPRAIRIAYIMKLFKRDNFKHAVFWSKAGLETLRTYGGVDDERVIAKSVVVYPAIRYVPDRMTRNQTGDVTLLFSGTFFMKGGANVVDAFERVQNEYPSVKLRLCCDEAIDFETPDSDLRARYLEKIRRNKSIQLGRVTRQEMMERVLPATDIYLLPSYGDTFGFALLEAMAHGIPVVSTNYFAIPEIVEHDVSGFLIDTSAFDCGRLFRGSVVKSIPADFQEHVTGSLFGYLCRLIESPALRSRFGRSGARIARCKFSMQVRNEKMRALYQRAVG